MSRGDKLGSITLGSGLLGDLVAKGMSKIKARQGMGRDELQGAGLEQERGYCSHTVSTHSWARPGPRTQARALPTPLPLSNASWDGLLGDQLVGLADVSPLCTTGSRLPSEFISYN